MSTTTLGGIWQWLAQSDAPAQARTGPEIKPRPGPIFIGDAVVPWKGSTLLLEILREDTDRDED